MTKTLIGQFIYEKLRNRQCRFYVHSIFMHSINLKSELGCLLTVQDETVAVTPVSVVNRPLLQLIKTRKVNAEVATWDGIHFAAGNLSVAINEDNVVICSVLDITSNIDQDFFTLKDLTLALGPQKSIAFCALPDNCLGDTATPSQIEVNRILRNVERLNYSNEISNELCKLIGLGEGLTPSGDDFLVGILAVLYSTPQKTEVGALRDAIADHILSNTNLTNDISAQFLKCACNGYFSRNICDILLSGDNKSLRDAVISQLQFGSTSGCDALGGILWAINFCYNII